MEVAVERRARQRAYNRCEYCLLPEECSILPFAIDHVIARRHRGSDDPENLCLSSCYWNLHKGPNLSGKDSKTKKIVPLFHPRRHKWDRHFRWKGPILIGKTPIGRATIATLGINLEHRVDLRLELIAEGVFQLSLQ